jgi:hypothetical protein
MIARAIIFDHFNKNFTIEEIDNYNCMEAAIAISKYANGRETDFCDKIKLISKGSKKN